MTAADVTRLRRDLAQRDALIERQAVQIDTQALTIERYRRWVSERDDTIAAMGRKIEWLESELAERKPTAIEGAEEVFRK